MTLNTRAFWISPSGKITEVTATHISAVIDRPEYFGLSIENIKAIYEEEHEDMPAEGRARERIILELVGSGWIRIRQYLDRQSKWTVNVHELNDGARASICKRRPWRAKNIKLYIQGIAL